VISPDDAFKYASFYREVLDREEEKSQDMEYDLSDLVCPLSKMKATEIIDNLREGEPARIILGDADSLKNVAKELKNRGIKPSFEPEGEGKYRLTIVK
ncbi:MAG TPA: sulfurtransferase TusA family protein, partial [Dehalococcoidales bacterium]|nr:sulfurtransferase TusA family protein [Dehalococcoidales bacterium]